VRGIPTLVFIDNSRNPPRLITTDGRALISQDPVLLNFPWPTMTTPTIDCVANNTVTLVSGNVTGAVRKLEEFANLETGGADTIKWTLAVAKKLEENTSASTADVTEDLAHEISNLLSSWTADHVFPVLDILRLVMAQPRNHTWALTSLAIRTRVASLFKHDDSQAPVPASAKLMCLRVFVNTVSAATASSTPTLSSVLDESVSLLHHLTVSPSTRQTVTGNKAATSAASALLLNTAILMHLTNRPESSANAIAQAGLILLDAITKEQKQQDQLKSAVVVGEGSILEARERVWSALGLVVASSSKSKFDLGLDLTSQIRSLASSETTAVGGSSSSLCAKIAEEIRRF